MRAIETRDEAERSVAHRRRGRSDGSSLRDRVVITATVIGVIVFVLIGLPYLRVHDVPPEGRPVPLPGDVASDPDRDAVRAWLRDNSGDAHPRELRWWRARTLDEFYRQQLMAAKDSAEDDPEMYDFVEQLESQGPDRVCRLKYRIKNDVGAAVSHDDLFSLRGGSVRRLRSDSSVANGMRKYFPDDAGDP
jgi:hypothetical protein